MTKKLSRIIASVMLVGAAAFVCYALGHPTASFPWNNTVTYVFYGLYLAVMIFFFSAPFKKSKSG